VIFSEGGVVSGIAERYSEYGSSRGSGVLDAVESSEGDVTSGW